MRHIQYEKDIEIKKDSVESTLKSKELMLKLMIL